VRINGSTALLTGAAGGIGRALARQLVEAGAIVVATGRQPEQLRAFAADIGVMAIPADLANPVDVTRLANECGDVDILVANAALPASGDLLDYTLEQIDRALAVNLRAPIVLSRLLAPRMVRAGRGHLAFIGSMSGKAATGYSSLYTASKFGLRGFAHSIRIDLRGSGVGVSLIQPGFVRDAGMFANTGEPTPSGVRTVTPDQVASATVAAIESDRAEVNLAPVKLRVLCAIAAQLPGLSERLGLFSGDTQTSLRIVEAQRASR
jgi:short-subunit dehydrogenase